MLCALLNTPACGISRDKAARGKVNLGILPGIGRNLVALDDHLLMNMEAQYATAKLLWLSMDEADLNRNPYAIDFINTDLALAPANFEENNITTQRFQFSRWSELTLSSFFKALFKTRADHRLLVRIPATVPWLLDGRHKSIYS